MDEIRELNEGRIPPMRTLLSLLGNARLLGLAPIPLEGEYEQLNSLPGPALVVFREQEREIFVVLVALEGDRARVIDPLWGEQILCREQFKDRWTGDVVVVQADDDGRSRVEEQLRKLRRRWPRVVFAGSIAAALIGAVPRWIGGAPMTTEMVASLIALAFVASVWLLLFGASCKVCSRTKVLSGRLPLEWVGVVLYGGLLPLALIMDLDAFARPLVCAAAGGHLLLIDLLRRNRIACKACLLTGSSIVLAAVVTMITSTWVLGLAWVVVGAVSMGFVVKVRVSSIFNRTMSMGWKTVAEMPAARRGTAQLRVIKRLGCGQCVLFESALRPALLERFGDAIEIEEGYSERPLITPLIAGVGSELSVVSLGLGLEGGEYERLCRIISALLAQSSPRALDGIEDISARGRSIDSRSADMPATLEPALSVARGEGL